MKNPYSGVGFFEFFVRLVERVGEWSHPASDEIQLAVLICCAIACGLIGPLLILKKISMFANSLSHTSLLGIVCAFLFVSHVWGGASIGPVALLLGAGLSALLTAALTEFLSRVFRLQPDASVGLVFTSLFALGILLVSLFTRDAHLSVEAVIGNPDALQLSDLRLASAAAGCCALMVSAFYRPLMLLAFDEPFLRASGRSALLWRSLLFLLTALTLVCSFRAVGVLVVLSLLTGPYLTVRLFSKKLKSQLLWTPLYGAAICAVGVALSRAFLSYTGVALSTGGFIALVSAAGFALALVLQINLFTRKSLSAILRGS